MSIFKFYDKARREIDRCGYATEVLWQASRCPENVSESFFLREAAWVIYCSGFRESTVRKYFNAISLCFCDWESAVEITVNSELCIMSAASVFNNVLKHRAVAEIASIIAGCQFSNFKVQLLRNPLVVLQALPYIGKVTSVHLAKNIGFDFAKPDRHLLRIGSVFGYSCVQKMCDDVSRHSGDSVKVVDIVFWRYMEMTQAKHMAC
jgi:hypothetical protein